MLFSLEFNKQRVSTGLTVKSTQFPNRFLIEMITEFPAPPISIDRCFLPGIRLKAEMELADHNSFVAWNLTGDSLKVLTL